MHGVSKLGKQYNTQCLEVFNLTPRLVNQKAASYMYCQTAKHSTPSKTTTQSHLIIKQTLKTLSSQ